MARTKTRKVKPTRAEVEAVLDMFRAWGRAGGAKGGHARAAKLTPEQRRESARKAAWARWARKRA